MGSNLVNPTGTQSLIIGRPNATNPTAIQSSDWMEELQYLQNLPAYNANAGVDSLLDLWRQIQESGNYYWQGLAFPDLQINPNVAANATISGTQVMPPGTYITGISAIALSTSSPFVQSAGFNLKIYDKGTKNSIYYGDYAQHSTVGGNFFAPTENIPMGSFLLSSPLIITGPGVIGWDIVNLDVTAKMIQVLIDCAVPITNRSIQNTVITKT